MPDLNLEYVSRPGVEFPQVMMPTTALRSAKRCLSSLVGILFLDSTLFALACAGVPRTSRGSFARWKSLHFRPYCRTSLCPIARRLELRGGGGVEWDERAADADFQDIDSEASAHGTPDVQAIDEDEDDLVDPNVSTGELIKREMARQEREARGETGEDPGETLDAGGGGTIEDEDVDEPINVDNLDPSEHPPEVVQAVERARSMKVPWINETIPFESLTLDDSITKHQMFCAQPTELARPERGHEVSFHFRGLYGDVQFEDSRTRAGQDSRPVAMRLGLGKGQAKDFPYMEAWELVLRSMGRGDVALFQVKGAKRVKEMLSLESMLTPEWVPRDGRHTIRFVVELLHFGLKDVVGDGGVLYRCMWDGTGDICPQPHDEVDMRMVARRDGRVIASTRGFRMVQLGVGLLPKGVETALVREFRKGSAGVVSVNGSYALPAPLEESSPELEGLARSLHCGDLNPWVDMCEGGSLGAVHPVMNYEALGDGQGAEYEVELRDWNEIHNLR